MITNPNDGTLGCWICGKKLGAVYRLFEMAATHRPYRTHWCMCMTCGVHYKQEEQLSADLLAGSQLIVNVGASRVLHKLRELHSSSASIEIVDLHRPPGKHQVTDTEVHDQLQSWSRAAHSGGFSGDIDGLYKSFTLPSIIAELKKMVRQSKEEAFMQTILESWINRGTETGTKLQLKVDDMLSKLRNAMGLIPSRSIHDVITSVVTLKELHPADHKIWWPQLMGIIDTVVSGLETPGAVYAKLDMDLVLKGSAWRVMAELLRNLAKMPARDLAWDAKLTSNSVDRTTSMFIGGPDTGTPVHLDCAEAHSLGIKLGATR